MKSTRCSNCGITLNLPSDFEGGAIQCPKCQKRFKAKPVAAVSTVTSQPNVSNADELFDDSILDNVSPPETSVTDGVTHSTNAAPDPTASGESAMENSTAAETTASSAASKAAIRMDFNFKRFWTPSIIKGSWWCVVVLSVLWFLFLSIFYVGAWFSGESMTSSASDILSGQGLNLQEILSGNADVDSLNKMLDKLDSSQSGGASDVVQLSTFQRVGAFTFTALSFVTLLASIVLSVLWCRVFFETIIVVFEIAARLKSIDEKTKDNS